MRKNYRLQDLTIVEIFSEIHDLTSELCERSQSTFRTGLTHGEAIKDITVKELEAVKNVELAASEARSVMEETGIIKENQR